jgi:hypothetical protein
MEFPYQFLDLTKEEKHLRRLTLDRYGNYAQLSALVPIALYLLYRAVVRVSDWALARFRKTSYAAVPSSPVLKVRRNSNRGGWATVARKWKWWLQDDISLLGHHVGQRDQWIFGSFWAAFLLFLCVPETGRGT